MCNSRHGYRHRASHSWQLKRHGTLLVCTFFSVNLAGTGPWVHEKFQFSGGERGWDSNLPNLTLWRILILHRKFQWGGGGGSELKAKRIYENFKFWRRGGGQTKIPNPSPNYFLAEVPDYQRNFHSLAPTVTDGLHNTVYSSKYSNPNWCLEHFWYIFPFFRETFIGELATKWLQSAAK